jgi:hypothetical protein
MDYRRLCAAVLVPLALVAQLCIWACAVQAQADPPSPEASAHLQMMEAVDAAIATSSLAVNSENYTISGPRFDPRTRQWSVWFQHSDGSLLTRDFFVTVDENSGKVCMLYEVGASCVAEGSVAERLRVAIAKAKALEVSKSSPAPDVEGLVVALLRHEAAAADSYLSSNRTFRFYLSLRRANPVLASDLSPEVFGKLKDTRLTFLPGSLWKSPGEVAVSQDAMLNIGEPLPRADGDYDVVFNYYCGGLCGSTSAAVMRHDELGWHVLSSAMTSIY